MARPVREVMTADPRTVSADATLVDAAKQMDEGDVGAILVEENGNLRGILTDRDIVVKAVARGQDPSSTRAADVTASNLVTIEADQDVHDAAQKMRDHEVRRLPVVESGRPVGIVSIGDLAVELDSDSALADISASAPNN